MSGRAEGTPTLFVFGLQWNLKNPARLRALFCFGGGGSSQRLFWQQPFYPKGCNPMQFFSYFEPLLSIPASVRANVFVFVDYEIFLPRATSSRIIILLFQYDIFLFQYLGLDSLQEVAQAL
ncbi:TPA: hypothetical protein DCX66_00250 [Candidatus Nomurabacteria bacterium]|nr:hypothetical protein [Candidatus Nomurabacteria bacterium]HAX64898.1 hypothetical protein [Candidatus Nomurabacteria bacterium]HCU01649.1 hypothetical protein [Candidatus Nomurabacteria bacterium]